MNVRKDWEKEDGVEGQGWTYSEDGLQRWRKNPEGYPSPIHTETVPRGASLTQQQYKEDCDVNLIMEKYMKLGQMPPFDPDQVVYGDMTSLPSYQEALDVVKKAGDLFLEIPAQIRQRFGNDPQQLMDFLASEKEDDIAESYKLGLRHKKPVTPDPNKPLIDKLDEIAQNTKKTKKPNTEIV